VDNPFAPLHSLTLAATMLLRAKYLLWKAGEPPTENAVVEIRGQRIASVGKFRSASRRKVRDLGEVVLLPGLVNAHCHLNYTHLADKITPSASFTGWLREMIALKCAAAPAEFAASVREGLRQLRKCGVATVCDIVSDNGDASQWDKIIQFHREQARRSGLRVIPFLEVLDLGRKEDTGAVIRAALRHVQRSGFQISPHSTYTVSEPLFKRLARTKTTLAIHIGESVEEFEMFTRGRGALYEAVRNLGADVSVCGGTTPVQYLHGLGLLTRRTLGIHLNCLAAKDFQLVARSRMSVVHCPRSHEYFRHQNFSAERLLKLRVHLCLGTDSAASIKVGRTSSLSVVERNKLEACPTLALDMFEEMRTFHRHHPKISAREILNMATLNGARALGQQKQLGSIERGKLADLIAVPAPSRKSRIEDAILHTRSPILFSIVGGKIVALN